MLATIASYTSASRLKKYAEYMGYSASVIQTPSHLTKEGCGYSVRFDDEYRMQIEKFAKELGVNIRSFFSEVNQDGVKKYIKES